MISEKLNKENHKEMQLTRAERNYYRQKKRDNIENYRKVISQNFYAKKEQK